MATTAGEISISLSTYKQRLNRLFDVWSSGKDETVWTGLDALVVLSGKQEEERITPKTDQLHLWLFGYVFPECLIVILKKTRKMYFLTGPKKLNILKQLQDENAVFLEKQTPQENLAKIKDMFNAIEKQSKDKLKLGRLLGKNETASGVFAQQIESAIKESLSDHLHSEIPIDHEMGLLMAIHDAKAVEAITKSAALSIQLAQEVVVSHIEDVLDNELPETHADIAATVEKALDDKKRQEKWQTKFGLEPEGLDLVYVNVFSGKSCDLRPSAVPTTEKLDSGPGSIIVAVGAKYLDFTSNVIRTLLFNVSKEKKQVYQVACQTIDYAISLLIPGSTFNEVYDKVYAFVKEKDPTLLKYMNRTFGHTLSIEFRESSLILNGKSNDTIVSGMVFNVSVGFANIPTADGKTNYSIWLADTVLVKPAGENPVVLTAVMDRQFKSVNYHLDDEPPPKQEPKKKQNTQPAPVSANSKDAKASTASKLPRDDAKSKGSTTSSSPAAQRTKTGSESVILRDRLRSRNKASSLEESEKLLQRQKTLRKRKLDDIRERFRDGANFATNKRSIRKMTSITAYKDASEYPKDMKPNKIHLDLAKETVLVPLPSYGHVPFHVSTIRNVFYQAEDKNHHVFRIHFQVPGSVGFGYKVDTNPFPEVAGPNGMFIKELIFRSSNPQLQQLFKSLKDLQQRIKQREETGDTSQDIAASVPLDLNRKGGKRVLLKSVMVKTGTQNRRTAGMLEAHLNGFRFQGGRSDTIDVNFANIKHAVFQPCENELLVLIHFHLKNPILVNKKKTTDIQFYTEVGSQTDDLDQRRGHSTYDPDEIAEEQRERELRKKLNIEFKRFVQATEEIARSSNERLEFDLPQRELGFHGVPKNSSQLMLPTSKSLVQLSEWPVFVLTLADIEIVSFERVFHGLRQFDMVFVFKDYTKPVQQITTIPIESLDSIKRWLNEIDIAWYESKGNLNWSEILKTIREDIEGFVSEGGFQIFLEDTNSNADEGEESDSDEGDEDYKETPTSGGGSDDDDDDEDESSGEDGGSDVGSDEESLASEESLDDEGGDQLDSDEEEGLSWDELEKRAIKEDRKKTTARPHENKDSSDDSEEERQHRKKRRK